MADEVDLTSDRAEAEAPRLMAASRKPEPPPATGKCLYCDADTPTPERHFCSAECCRAWDYERQRQRVNGVRP